MTNHHFIAKLVPGGGPPPLAELESIILEVGDAPGPLGWLGTRKPGTEWQPPPAGIDAVCIAFFDNREDGCIDAVVAKVLGKHGEMPQSQPLIELHAGHHGFRAWWQLQDPVRLRLPSLDAIPGRSARGKIASETFKGSSTFAYWSFDNDKGDLPLEQVVKLLTRTHAVLERPDAQRAQSEGPQQVATLRARAFQAESLPPRKGNLYGVDFSGGQETARGNPKIWIASWSLHQETVTLRRGNDNGALCRSDLPAFVQHRPGWWVFDFPFGVARESAEAILHNPRPDWAGWLEWCAAEGNATERRDLARQMINAAGVPWSTRRHVDEEHGTTWFPLFEQLYRQTIYGAREVLQPLAQMDRMTVSVLPWHDLGEVPTIVTEGFPGMTIRRRLGLAGSGYKGLRNEHSLERQAIINSLMSPPYHVPIPQDVIQRAVADTEGDAVDALVLLVAAWVSQSLGDAAWQECREDLGEDGRLVEGWFPE